MDLADDIGYAVHDVDDFYRGGLIPLDRLCREQKGGERNEEREWFFVAAKNRWERLGKRRAHSDAELEAAFTSLVELLPIDAPFTGARKQRETLRTMTAGLIGRYVNSVTLNEARRPDEDGLLVPDEVKREIAMLMELTWAYVIDHAGLATQQHGQRHIIRELFRIYSCAASEKELAIFPPTARERLEMVGDHREGQLRIACDLIAGMTEQQAIDVYQRLSGIDFGSVLDRFR
jgi:dGTPase